jgi:hypothetical protein
MNAIRISALAGAMLLAGASLAHAQAAPDPVMAAGPAAPPSGTAPPAGPAMPPAGSDGATTPAMVVAGSPGASATQVAALSQGDNRMVTNGPVPDTPANRAKYGKPMSHAGKKTTPSGN